MDDEEYLSDLEKQLLGPVVRTEEMTAQEEEASRWLSSLDGTLAAAAAAAAAAATKVILPQPQSAPDVFTCEVHNGCIYEGPFNDVAEHERHGSPVLPQRQAEVVAAAATVAAKLSLLDGSNGVAACCTASAAPMAHMPLYKVS